MIALAFLAFPAGAVSGSDYSALYERDLFDLAPPPPPPAPPAPDPPPAIVRPRPPEPTLDQFFSLKGVIVSDPSLALIEDSRTGQASIYEQGDRLPGGTVARVDDRRVFLRDDAGREFELSLEMEGPAPARRATERVSPEPPRPRGTPRPAPVEPERRPDPPAPAAPGTDSLPSLSLSAVGREMSESREELSRLQILPVIRGGQVAGYRVRNLSGRLAEMAAGYGFRDGDVVTSINRQPVRSLSDMADAYRSASPGSAVSVTIMRGEETIDLNFTVEQ